MVFNMLAEATTTELSKVREPKTFEGNRRIAIEGGTVAGNARREIEGRSGRPVIIEKMSMKKTR